MPSDDDEELRRLHEKLNDNFNSIRNENEKQKNNSKSKPSEYKGRFVPETIDMVENKDKDGKIVYEVHNHNTYNTYNVNNNEEKKEKTPFWKTALKTGGILALGSAIIVIGIPILLVKTISFVKENWKIITALLIMSALITSTNKGCSCSLVNNEVRKSKVSHYETKISKDAITLMERKTHKKSKCLNTLYNPKKA